MTKCIMRKGEVSGEVVCGRDWKVRRVAGCVETRAEVGKVEGD